jgi:hypothetical protein
VEVSAHVSTGSHEDPSVDGDTTETRMDVSVDDDSDDDFTEDMVIKATDNRDDRSTKFPHFDVTKSPPDQHYFDTMEEVGVCTNTF